jgi:hypothetical protein
MKKVLVMLAFLALLAGSVYADDSIIDGAIKYIVDHPKQTSIFYNFDQREAKGIVGFAPVTDIFVKGLDLAANYDFDEGLIGTVDYTFKKGATISPFIQAGIGLHRIEKAQRDSWGELIYGAGAGLKF